MGRVIAVINPILRGWVNYFRIGHASRCFAFVRTWVEQKVRRHLMRARNRRGFGTQAVGGKLDRIILLLEQIARALKVTGA